MSQKSIEELHGILAFYSKLIGHKIKHLETDSYYCIESVYFDAITMRVRCVYTTLHNTPVKFGRPVDDVMDHRWFKIYDMPI